MTRPMKWTMRLVAIFLLLSACAGYWAASMSLHPMRRALTPELIAEADEIFRRDNASRIPFEVRAADGVLLRGWLVRPSVGQGGADIRDWVLLFHGVSDNRVGDIGVADFLLRAGYGVVMMDSRAHGKSEGDLATYGWKEREDTRAIVSALQSKVNARCIFAFGVSMGAGIALEAAATEPRIVAVAAEAPFSSFREASYDYAGLHWNPWLGRTLFRPVVEAGFIATWKIAGFRVSEVSPANSVAQRPFPILLIGDADDVVIPLRHQREIYSRAIGQKELWIVAGAAHASAMGVDPQEYERRVLSFFDAAGTKCAGTH